MKISAKEIILLLSLIFLFIFIRSIHFPEYVNFTSDQGEQATDVLELVRAHKLTLIGNPITSVVYQGRLMFQGPAYYYMLAFFMAVGQWDPIISSYIFMIFCALMIIPLYYGTTLLLNKRAAIIFSILYTLVPYYINYTRFHWNPTYQLSLLPLLILLMGLHKQTKKTIWLFLIPVLLGILLQFHYQFIIAVAGIFLFYFITEKKKGRVAIFFPVGIMIGLAPLILFELKNQFYNINTFLLYVHHWKDVQKAGSIHTLHYYLGFSVIAFLTLLAIFKKYIQKIPEKIFLIIIAILIIGLGSYDLLTYSKVPKSAFWSYSSNWHYTDEKYVNDIIRKTGVKDYNVANLTYYDTYGAVQKFLLKRNHVDINYDDYYHNKNLFVISSNNDFDTDMPYEVLGFRPMKVKQSWKINQKYSLYLLEKLPQQ